MHKTPENTNHPENHEPKSKYMAGLLIGILAVSTASLFIRYAQQDMPSLVIAAGRLTLATLVILPFGILSWIRNSLKLDIKTWGLLILAGVFLGMHFVTWISSLEYTSVASSVVLVTTAPLWVAIFSPVILNEKLNKWILLGLVIALCGAMVVGVGGSCSIENWQLKCDGFSDWWSGRNFIGNILALCGALLSAAYIMVGRSVRHRLPLSVYTSIVYGIASVVLILLVILTGSPVTGHSANSYLFVVALALIPQVIGHTAFNWALKYLSAAYVSIALLGEPIGTVILAAVFLKESPSTLEYVGGILILLGISLATLRTSQKSILPVEPGGL